MSDLLQRLHYHGTHCLDRNGEQSRTMLEAASLIGDQLSTICDLATKIERLREALSAARHEIYEQKHPNMSDWEFHNDPTIKEIDTALAATQTEGAAQAVEAGKREGGG